MLCIHEAVNLPDYQLKQKLTFLAEPPEPDNAEVGYDEEQFSPVSAKRITRSQADKKQAESNLYHRLYTLIVMNFMPYHFRRIWCEIYI